MADTDLTPWQRAFLEKLGTAERLTDAFHNEGITLRWVLPPEPKYPALANVPGIKNGLLSISVNVMDFKVRVRLTGGAVPREWEPGKSGLNVEKIARRAQAEIRSQSQGETEHAKRKKRVEYLAVKLAEIKQALAWEDEATRSGFSKATTYLSSYGHANYTLSIYTQSPEILRVLMQAYLDATKD